MKPRPWLLLVCLGLILGAGGTLGWADDATCLVEAADVCVDDPMKFDFYGYVHDSLERPIEAARVEDEFFSNAPVDYTDALGMYRFREEGFPLASYELKASKDWMVAAYRLARTLVGDDTRVDFVLSYRLMGRFSPSYIAQPGDSVTYSIKAKIPEPVSVCMRIERTGPAPDYERSRHFATYASTEAGISTWVFVDGVVPDDIPRDASIRIDSIAEDCETRTELGRNTDWYYVP